MDEHAVDSHVHFAPVVSSGESDRYPRVVRSGGESEVWFKGSRVDSIVKELAAVPTILEQELACGIDRVVLSPWVALIPNSSDVQAATRDCRHLNSAIAAAVSRFTEARGLATVPMADPKSSIEVLREALEMGLVGAEITPMAGKRFVGEEPFEPFWRYVAEQGVPIFIHPSTHGLGIGALESSYLWNSLGNPVETGVAGAQLVMCGLLERYPDLRIVLAHSGGVLPWIIGRIDHSFGVRAEARSRLRSSPMESFRRLFYDSISHGEAQLRTLVELVGASQIVLGTDHPFDMGEYGTKAVIEDLGLSKDERDRIVFGNALELFGLSR